MKTIIAIDPGKMTGVAVWADGEHTSAQLEMMPLLEYVETVVERTQSIVQGEVVIVCETYTITAETAKKSRQTWSLEIIGVLKWMAHVYGRELVLQSPADAKRFSTDVRLREMDMWVKGQDHARDAYRHLLLYLAKSGEVSLKAHE